MIKIKVIDTYGFYNFVVDEFLVEVVFYSKTLFEVLKL